MGPAEVLIELEPGTTADAAVPDDVRVVQQMPPRLAIVSADEAGIRALEAAPGVSAVFAGDVPPEALERLDVVGRAFATGWNERRRPKDRIGDGLAWDTPGFEAP
jgi:hypothetical protein